MDAAYLFAKNFVNTKYENLPPEVVDATKKEILAYAVTVAEKIGFDAPFDIATRDLLYVFPNGRARLGGMQAEPTGEFSSTIVYRYRPESKGEI